MKVYFARPISNYKTLQDQRDIELIQSLGFELLNPDKEEFAEKYKTEGMSAFYNAISQCDGVIFRSFVDGNISAGVYGEICYAVENNKFVLELPTISSKRVLCVDDTRTYLKLLGNR